MAQIEDQILTTGEAAALLCVSRSTLRRAVAQGHLQAWQPRESISAHPVGVPGLRQVPRSRRPGGPGVCRGRPGVIAR